MAIGGFCLVLHGHLPYVLHHGVWPHGEDWLYEATAETYLPILAMINECVFFNAKPHLVMGLTPVLLEQLAHEDFKRGFERYLADRVERAQSDRREFERMGDGHLAYLAGQWAEFYGKLQTQFAAIKRDIPGAYAKWARENLIEILTSTATHAFLPLLYEDSCIRAQLRGGLASSHRILGFKPSGIWLPECAYRPCGPWSPPNGWPAKGNRIGIEHLVADETLDHFFVEHHLIERANSEFVNNGRWEKVSWEEATKYPARGWRDVHEPHLVNSDGTGPGRAAALARDNAICEKVWSGDIGYPADGVYLEFHKKWGAKRGLRYWKVTGRKVDLGQKHYYYPQDIAGKIHEHATHFCGEVKRRLWEYHHRTGRYGLVTACFDAELFGHWWFEGVRFLRDVMLNLNADPDVDLSTAAGHLHYHPPDKTVSLPAGSWGEGGDYRVWADAHIHWMWDIEYRCEANFGKATFELPWQKDKKIEELLQKAGRELFLLQASDWQFNITRGQSVDYAIKRYMQHVSRFEIMLDLAEKLAQDSQYLGRLNEVEQHEVRDAELHDVIFPNIDLKWWAMGG